MESKGHFGTVIQTSNTLRFNANEKKAKIDKILGIITFILSFIGAVIFIIGLVQYFVLSFLGVFFIFIAIVFYSIRVYMDALFDLIKSQDK